MDFNQELLEKVDAEIERLNRIRAMLIGVSVISAPSRKRTPSRVKRGIGRVLAQRKTAPRRAAAPERRAQVRRPMSAADRKKRSDAQKARWARVKTAGSTPAPQSVQESDSSKTTSLNVASQPIKAVS